MKADMRLPAVSPCSSTCAKVRKANPAMNTSAAPSTSRRVTARAGPRWPSVDRVAGRLWRAAHGEHPDQRKAEEEAAQVSEIGDSSAATSDGVGQVGGPEVDLLE